MYITKMFAERGIQSDKINIVVNLSTSNKTKDWDVYKYIDVCQRIIEKYDVNYFVIGAGRMCADYADVFMKHIYNAFNFVNKTTIRQMVELISRSHVYLGGDTGILHVATAFNLDGVAIYKNAKDIEKSPRPDEWYGPWHSSIKVIQPKHNLPGCEYECSKDAHCINQVTSNEVFQILDQVLAARIQ